MGNRKIKKVLEVYGLIGKSLCACAGGIVGFILGGPFLAIPCIFIGAIGGHLAEKGVLSTCK